jgi:hypothetical protein
MYVAGSTSISSAQQQQMRMKQRPRLLAISGAKKEDGDMDYEEEGDDNPNPNNPNNQNAMGEEEEDIFQHYQPSSASPRSGGGANMRAKIEEYEQHAPRLSMHSYGNNNNNNHLNNNNHHNVGSDDDDDDLNSTRVGGSSTKKPMTVAAKRIRKARKAQQAKDRALGLSSHHSNGTPGTAQKLLSRLNTSGCDESTQRGASKHFAGEGPVVTALSCTAEDAAGCSERVNAHTAGLLMPLSSLQLSQMQLSASAILPPGFLTHSTQAGTSSALQLNAPRTSAAGAAGPGSAQ